MQKAQSCDWAFVLPTHVWQLPAQRGSRWRFARTGGTNAGLVLELVRDLGQQVRTECHVAAPARRVQLAGFGGGAGVRAATQWAGMVGQGLISCSCHVFLASWSVPFNSVSACRARGMVKLQEGGRVLPDDTPRHPAEPAGGPGQGVRRLHGSFRAGKEKVPRWARHLAGSLTAVR